MTHENTAGWNPGVDSDLWGEHWDLEAEILRQNGLWGRQNHPDISGPRHPEIERGQRATYNRQLRDVRKAEAHARAVGTLGWDLILLEEVYEALSEPDDDKRRTELIQVAAVALQWAGAIRRRKTS